MKNAWLFMFVIVAAMVGSYLAFSPANKTPIVPPKSAKIFPQSKEKVKKRVPSNNLEYPESRQEKPLKSGLPLREATPHTTKTPIPPADTKLGERIIKGVVSAVDRDARTITLRPGRGTKLDTVTKVNLASGAVIQGPEGNITIGQLRAGSRVEIILTKANQGRAVKITNL